MKGRGKRQRVKVSSLTSPGKVTSHLSFHCWKRRFAGKGVAIFFFKWVSWYQCEKVGKLLGAEALF